ncbi:MAG: hypothetical protein JRN51_08775, partial [Nitrososphaerota archaeon]|nr:hypothetical protein [Nitrososphaerota archaeon]
VRLFAQHRAVVDHHHLEVEPLAQEAGELAADASSPTSDIRGTEEYKRGLIRLLVARGLERASQRARRRT